MSGRGISGLVVVLALLFGTLGGGVAGALIAGRDSNDPQTVVVTATPDEVAIASQATMQAVVVTEVVPTETTMPTATPSPTPSPTATPPAEVVDVVADLVERVNPAVVTVINQQRFSGFSNSGDNLQPAGTGTGFVIDSAGTIVTNHHVVEGSEALSVIFSDGREVPAELLGTDAFADLAVLRVSEPVSVVLELGDATALRPGQTVVAIGSALGNYTNTVTTGVISGLGRQLEVEPGLSLEGLIQHDAPINPGNSGGPLLNLQGEVIGVNVAVVRQASDGRDVEGLGFAISSTTLQQVAVSLLDSGRVLRPYMGISYELVTPLSAQSAGLPVDHGILITLVPDGGPSAAAGVQVGDVITDLGGTPIDDDHPFVNLLFGYAPGDTITLGIYRPSTDETLTLDVVLGERPADLP